MTRLVALYPRAWRDRYELEFLALMVERRPSPLDRIDIMRGAIDARLHPQFGSTNSSGRDRTRSARLGGIGAVIGGGLWAAAGLAFHSARLDAALGYKDSGSSVWVAVGAALLTGLAALIVSRSVPGRHMLMSSAAIGTVVGAVLLALPWPILVLGLFGALAGTAMFGLLVTRWTGGSGILLVVGAVLAFGFNTEDERALFLLPLGAAWVLIGVILAVRGVRPIARSPLVSAAEASPSEPGSRST